MKKVYALLVTLLIIAPALSAQAQGVDLLWQGQTYTPPFYKGKTFWSKQSKITLLAIPYDIGNPANLTYKWTRNGTVLGNISGVGKNTIGFYDSILSKSQTIKVDLLSSDNSVLASASVVIKPVSPALVVYENNPLYGFMFHKETTGTYSLQGKEITFTSFPFFFDTLNRADSAIRYEWRTNVGGAETGNSITYRSPDGVAGSAKVKASAAHQEKILQEADKEFLVQFGNQ